jgi:hypothetical protein
MMRLSLYLIGHNYLKPFRVNPHHGLSFRTHAEAAGIPPSWACAVAKHLTAGLRAFLSRSPLSVTMRRTWEKGWRTPGKKKPEYVPKYALA